MLQKESNIPQRPYRHSDFSCPLEERQRINSTSIPEGREDRTETPYVLSSAFFYGEGQEAVGEGTREWPPDLCSAPAPSYSWVGGGCGVLETIQIGVICH